MEDQLKFLIEQNKDGIFCLDSNGNFTRVNNGLISITGTSQDDLLKRKLWSFAAPEDREGLIRIFQKAFSGDPQTFETLFYKLNGRQTVLEIHLAATNPNEVYGIAKDITQLRETEYALEQKTRRFDALQLQGSDLIAILDSEGIFQFVSENSLSVLGYKPKYFINKNFFSLIHPEDRENLQRKFLNLLNGSEQIQQISRIQNRDGVWRWIESKARDLRHDPTINGIVVNSRDITENLLSRKDLEESEQKYRAFFENSLDGILLISLTGEIFAANPAACEMFQMSEKELCIKGRSGIVDESDPKVIAALKERQVKDKTVAEIPMFRKGGSRFPAEVSSAAFKDRSGEIRASVKIRDISDKKLAHEKIEASQKEYQLLFQNNPLPTWIYDRSSLEILNVNEAAIKKYGYSKKELLQMKITDLRPEEEVRKLKSFLEEWKDETGVVIFGTSVHQKKNNELINVEISGYHLQFAGRDCTMAVCNDLTKRNEAFQKLEIQKEKLLAAQKIARIGSWEINFAKEEFLWSEEVFRIWERREDIFKPTFKNVYETIHSADLEPFKAALQSTFSGEEEINVEFRITTPDGLKKWVHSRGNFFSNSFGRIQAYEGTFQDITQRKTFEESLRASEARFKGIINSQTNYLIRIDLEANFTFVNQKYLEDFGWIFPDQNPVGNKALLATEPEHQQQLLDAFDFWISNPNTVHQVEINKVQKEEEPKATLWDFICLTDSEGKPLEVQGVGIDITERVKAEKLLQESNERYELVSKATLDAIYDWNCQTGKMLWSKGYNNLVGVDDALPTPEDIDSWKNLVHLQDQKVVSDLVATLNGTNTHWEAEYRFQRSNGEYAHVVEKGFIVRGKDNKVRRMVGTVRDVTEKKKLEDLLDKASRLARIGSYENDLIANTLYWSPVTREIMDVSADKVINFNLAISFYKEGEHRNKIEEAFHLAVNENIPFDLESIIVTEKGKERWVRSIGQPEFVDGKCVRLSGSFQDIDTIKRAQQEAIKASEEKESILESIGDAFFAVNNNWVVTYFNKHAEKLLECPRDEILGKNVWNIFPDAIDTDFYTFYHKAVKENRVQNFEEYFERVNRWFDVSAYPSPHGLSVYFRDVTERKNSSLKLIELNEDLKSYTNELVSANAGLEQFSYIVSHNLRSPVANILGLANFIEDEQFPQDLRNNLLKELFNNVKRLDTVIKDLNSILQLKTDISTKKEAVNLEELVLSIQNSIHYLIQKEQVQIITDFSELPEVITVSSYLHSIFYNLITNSIKYHRPGVPPIIHISSEKTEERAILRFRDNGLGLNLEKRGDQIFGLYKRFHSHVEGKGIGLFMVKTQVEAIGGKIQVQSEVNRGTEFTVEFGKT